MSRSPHKSSSTSSRSDSTQSDMTQYISHQTLSVQVHQHQPPYQMPLHMTRPQTPTGGSPFRRLAIVTAATAAMHGSYVMHSPPKHQQLSSGTEHSFFSSSYGGFGLANAHGGDLTAVSTCTTNTSESSATSTSPQSPRSPIVGSPSLGPIGPASTMASISAHVSSSHATVSHSPYKFPQPSRRRILIEMISTATIAMPQSMSAACSTLCSTHQTATNSHRRRRRKE